MANGGCEWGRGGDLLRSVLVAVVAAVVALLLMMTMRRASARVGVFVVC